MYGIIYMRSRENFVIERTVTNMYKNKSMKMKDVIFVKCEEYDPYSPKANSLGMKPFWRAEYNDETIAIADTKSECVSRVRLFINSKI